MHWNPCSKVSECMCVFCVCVVRQIRLGMGGRWKPNDKVWVYVSACLYGV